MKLSFFNASFLAIFIFLNTATFSGEKVASGIAHIQDNFRKFVNESAEIKEEEAKQQAIEVWKKNYKEVMGGEKSEILRRGPTKEEFNIIKMTLHNFVQKSVDADFEQLKQNYDAELLDGAKKRHLRALLILANAIKINKTEGDAYYTKNTAEAEKNQPIVTKTLEALEHMGFTQEQVDANSVNRILKHYNSPENGSLFYTKERRAISNLLRALKATKADTLEKVYDKDDIFKTPKQGIYYLKENDPSNDNYYNIPDIKAIKAGDKDKPNIPKKVSYLIQKYGLGIPKDYFDDEGNPKDEFLKIEKLVITAAAYTEAIYGIKIKHANMNEFKLLYIVKIPAADEVEDEVKGLYWLGETLGNLPLTQDWAEMKFPEAVFFDEKMKSPILFLHAAHGEPWSTYIRKTINQNLPNSLSKISSEKAKTKEPAVTRRRRAIIVKEEIPTDRKRYQKTRARILPQNIEVIFTEDILEDYVRQSYKMARTLGLLERKYVKGDWKNPSTLFTISFLDSHAGNIFYSDKFKKFSWIDLSSLGFSAFRYYSQPDYYKDKKGKITKPVGSHPKYPTPLAGGLHQMIYLTFGRQPEDLKDKRITAYSESHGFRRLAFEAIIEGYLSAFEDTDVETVRNIVNDLDYVKKIREDLDKYLPIPLIDNSERNLLEGIVERVGFLKEINENMDYYFPVQK